MQQSPPSKPSPGPEQWGGRPIPPTRDYKTRRAMRYRQGQLPGFRRGPRGRCSLATGLSLYIRTAVSAVRLQSPQCSLRRGTSKTGAVASGGGSHTTAPAN